jgi:hypothetical protein
MSDVSTILAELEKLEPSGLTALEPRFHEFYPVIKAKLDQGLKRKEIIALLAKHGVEVHHMQFEALMKTIEVERRGDAVEVGVKQ